MAVVSQRVTKLLVWCAQRGIKIDSRVAVLDSDHSGLGTIAVYSNAFIPSMTSLVQIPKSAILSSQSCTLSKALRPLYDDSEEEPNMAFAVAVLTELKLGQRSRWYDYLKSLPRDVVDIAVLWESDGGTDGVQARRWCRGTEVEKLLLKDQLESTLHSFWDDAAEPLLISSGVEANYEDLRHAYSLVSSRAFYVDGFHGISMVPIADAFNHIEENHIHLETDFDVCATCGSLDACEHDEEDELADDGAPSTRRSGNSRSPHKISALKEDLCEMVTNAAIHPGDEVFNSYDSHLSNAQLLCHYGFLLEGNSNDVVTWSVGEILTSDLDRQLDTVEPSLRACIESLEDDDIELLYDPSSSHAAEGVGEITRRICLDHLVLGVNAEGAVSRHLFGLILVRTLLCWPDDRNNSTDTAFHDLPRLTRRIIEILSEMGHTVDEAEDATGVSPNTVEDAGHAREVVIRVSAALQRLVADRISQIGLNAQETGGADWGDILDTTPLAQKRTRLALTHAISERSMLESCLAAWTEVSLQLQS